MPIVLFFAFFLTHSAEAAYYHFTTDYPPVYETVGTDWLSRLEVFSVFDGKGKKHEFMRAGHRFEIQWDALANRIRIWRDGKLQSEMDLQKVLDRAKQANALTQEILTEKVQGKGTLKAYFEDISVEWPEQGKPKILHLKADLLFSEVH